MSDQNVSTDRNVGHLVSSLVPVWVAHHLLQNSSVEYIVTWKYSVQYFPLIYITYYGTAIYIVSLTYITTNYVVVMRPFLLVDLHSLILCTLFGINLILDIYVVYPKWWAEFGETGSGRGHSPPDQLVTCHIGFNGYTDSPALSHISHTGACYANGGTYIQVH